MSENLQGLFSATTQDATTGSARSLAGTAQLTSRAAAIASGIISVIDTNLDEYRDLFARSKNDNNAMDQLILKTYEITDEDVQFLKELDEATLDGMLKSQQSKRSRAKSKTMTLDNYKSMMMGALGELMIRKALGKAKSATVRYKNSTSLEYTAEQIEKFKTDQEAVRREVRNIQSKKSIMKSKAGFSFDVNGEPSVENDEADNIRWQQLCEAEELLKSIRDSVQPIIVDETKNKLTEMLDGVDINQLKSADAKKLLEQALQLIKAEETTNEAQQ